MAEGGALDEDDDDVPHREGMPAADDGRAPFEEDEELEERTAWERLRAWFERPATLFDLAALTALIVAMLAGLASLVAPRTTGPASATRPVGTALSSRQIAALLELPARQAVPAGIEVANRPDAVFAPGERVQLRVTLRAPARVALLLESPEGPPTQVWPGLGLAPALVPRPTSGGPAILPVELAASTTAGAQRVRLVVAPADLDLGALAASSLAAAADRLTLVDLRYEVRLGQPATSSPRGDDRQLLLRDGASRTDDADREGRGRRPQRQVLVERTVWLQRDALAVDRHDRARIGATLEQKLIGS
jgi:hypothetical protein